MSKRSLTQNKLVHSALALFVLDMVFYGTLNTSKVAQFMLIVGLVVLIANIYLLTYGITSLIRLYGAPIKRKKRASIYISLFLGLLVAMQSIGELSSKDALVIVLLAVSGYAYLAYVSMAKQKQQKL